MHEVELAAIEMRHGLAEAAIEARLVAIRMAREMGCTWEQIARAMNMSRQSAHKRFGRAVGDLHSLDDDDR